MSRLSLPMRHWGWGASPPGQVFMVDSLCLCCSPELDKEGLWPWDPQVFLKSLQQTYWAIHLPVSRLRPAGGGKHSNCPSEFQGRGPRRLSLGNPSLLAWGLGGRGAGRAPKPTLGCLAWASSHHPSHCLSSSKACAHRHMFIPHGHGHR